MLSPHANNVAGASTWSQSFWSCWISSVTFKWSRSPPCSWRYANSFFWCAMIKSHDFALEFDNPLRINGFDDRFEQEILDTLVSFKLCLLCFVLGNLSLMNCWILINVGRVGSRIGWLHKSCGIMQEKDVFSFVDDHSNVSMLASSICGRNAGCCIDAFFCKPIQILVGWLAVDFGEFEVFETVFRVLLDSHAWNKGLVTTAKQWRLKWLQWIGRN